MLPNSKNPIEAEGLKLSCCHTDMNAGEGPAGGMLGMDLLQRNPIQAPERHVHLERSTRVTEHKVF